MDITVIVCTHNRCQSLATALQSVALSNVPPSIEWEILVVDNNSKDKTREVVDDFCKRYPNRFRYFFESKPGKSHALNSGILASTGKIFAFMDDDVTVESDWLYRITASLHEDKWVGSGGRVIPQWTIARPSWLKYDTPNALAPLVSFDLGPTEGPLLEPPYGTNMAFQRHMFEEFGVFRTDLGPQPGSEIRGEDSEFVYRLLKAGKHLRYEPSAVVHHPVTEDRLKKGFFLAWWFDKGRAEVRSFRHSFEDKVCLKGVPMVLVRRISVWTLRWIVTPREASRFSSKMRVWYLAGQIQECYQAARQTSASSKPTRSG